MNKHYNIIVIGAGHAGCEAAISASRLGASVLLLTMYLDSIALMPCNPSIGGPAKGHIVREIDALGGVMAEATDASTRHIRWLNTSKGSAVRTLRAQCDPRKYSDFYRKTLLNEPNLTLFQAEVTDLLVESGTVKGVKIKTGQVFEADCVILATGTYLASEIFIGLTHHKSGPLGLVAATPFARSLKNCGLECGRLRTDTTPRLLESSVNWDILEKQHSLTEPQAFSHFCRDKAKKVYDEMFCGITRTNEATHEAIRKYFNQSPLYTEALLSKGPRYCPSIDDKILRFPEKPSHPIFLEPISGTSGEVYMQNFSTSMCLEAQWESVRTIKGCEEAVILRPGYAIEYEYIFPTQLTSNFETRNIKNLFTAGQINGTSGYEEAGGQGLLAGINAALRVRGEGEFILGRHESYIGILIDDLVTKGTKEPYRMLTSRAEYRLLLRHDNATERLSDKGHEIGLLSDEKFAEVLRFREEEKRCNDALTEAKILMSEENNKILESLGSSPLAESVTAQTLLRRPEISWSNVKQLAKLNFDDEVGQKVEAELKYEGYISRQKNQVKKFERMEKLRIPEKIDFGAIVGLSDEGRTKMSNSRPSTLGQASRIPGVPPSDIQLLWIAIEKSHQRGE